MAERFVFAVPGSLATLTGGYQYDAKVIDGLRQRGYAIALLSLGDGFPDPDAKTRVAAEKTVLDATLSADAMIVDGLALGVLPEAALRVSMRTRLIALVHHPLAHEHGLLPETAARLFESEKRALASASHVIATSETTARLLQSEYGVEKRRLSVARPGTEPVERTLRVKERSPGPIRLLSVAAISPRKGFDVTIAALAGLKDLDWRLVIAGDETRSPSTAAALRDQIALAGLADRVALMGGVAAADLKRFYREVDLFVLASYYEGYGMVYAEALAYGLPIVGTTGGAIPEVVPEAAGILVPPGDVGALTVAARRASRNLPRWSEAVDVMQRLLNGQNSR